MVARRSLLLLASFISWTLVACDSDGTGPDEMHALFDLTQVEDTPLPVLGAPNGGCPVMIDHGSVALDSNGRFSAMIDAGATQCEDGESQLAYWPDAGTYGIFGDSIAFDPDGDSPAYSGRFVDGDRHFLELHHPRGTYLYVRFR